MWIRGCKELKDLRSEKRFTVMKKLEFIDALRGLAILGVIMVHTGHSIGSSGSNLVDDIVGSGARGVQLFFIASAFTLFRSYKNRSVIEHHTIANFFIRRFFRIAPMYYIGIFYYLFQRKLEQNFGVPVNSTNLCVASNFLFLHGVSPNWINSLVPGGWSITVEVWL